MDPITLATMGLSLASSGLDVAGTLFGARTKATNALSKGNETAMSDAFRAQQLEREASYGEIKADQVDAFMRDSLQSSLANIQAVRASAGTSGDSPTGQAILARTEFLGDQARQQKVANIHEQVQADRDASAFYAQAGLRAIKSGQQNSEDDILSGELSAGGKVLSAVSGPLSKFAPKAA